MTVEQRDFRAGRGERFRCCGADCAGGAGDDGNLSSQRPFLACAELGLLQRPVFDIEHVGLGDRFEAADPLCIGDDPHPFFGDVRGDDRIALGPAQAEQTQARHQSNAGQGIELALSAADALVVALEITPIIRGESVGGIPGGAREIFEFAFIRMRQNQRPVLGANGVIRRNHTAFG